MLEHNNYSEYISNLSYDELVQIANRIDKEKYYERYALIMSKIDELGKSNDYKIEKERKEKETEEELHQYLFGFISLVIILGFELFVNSIFNNQSIYLQISRFTFIVITALCFSIPSYKDVGNDKKGLIQIALGSIAFTFVIGVIPRIVEKGYQAGIDLALLEEGIFIPYSRAAFSIKSNFIVPLGYGFAMWALWCICLNTLRKKR